MTPNHQGRKTATRTQTGLRLDATLLKVLKAVAELNDQSLGELVEGVLFDALEGKAAFGAKALAQIRELRAVYGLDAGRRSPKAR